MSREIRVRVRTVFGRKVFEPLCEVGRKFLKLQDSGRSKNLSGNTLRVAKELGFKVVAERPDLEKLLKEEV